MNAPNDNPNRRVDEWPQCPAVSEPIAAWSLSQTVRGWWAPTSQQVVSAPHLQHRTLAMQGALTLEAFANDAGGSVLNAELVGPIRMQLELRFVGDSPSDRGLHSGSVAWGPNAEVTAAVHGTTNAVARNPTRGGADDSVPLTLTGQMRGGLDHDVLGYCEIAASYYFAVDSLDEGGADVVGTIEGIITTQDSVDATDGP